MFMTWIFEIVDRFYDHTPQYILNSLEACLADFFNIFFLHSTEKSVINFYVILWPSLQQKDFYI